MGGVCRSVAPIGGSSSRMPTPPRASFLFHVGLLGVGMTLIVTSRSNLIGFFCIGYAFVVIAGPFLLHQLRVKGRVGPAHDEADNLNRLVERIRDHWKGFVPQAVTLLRLSDRDV